MFGAIFALIGQVAGSWFAKEGNNRAAKRGARSEDAINALDAIDAEEERARISALEKQAQPGMNYLRGLISQDPSMVTPEQQQVIDEGMRDTIRTISPGLRGSGRTTTNIVRAVEDNTRNKFLTQNKNQSIDAAGRLQGMMMPISGAYSDLYKNRGRNRRDSMRNKYEIQGNADTANAGIASNTAGGAIGAVGGIFNADAPAGGTDYSGAQGSPAELGGALPEQNFTATSAMSRLFADDEGRRRKYGGSSSTDVRAN